MARLCWICSSHLGSSDIHRYAKFWKRRHLNTIDFFSNFTISSSKFLKGVALFFKNDMDNPSSNFTWSKMKCIPIGWYHTWSIHVLYVLLSTTLSPKIEIVSRGHRVGILFTKTYRLWHRSVDKNSYLHVKFEVRFLISFMKRSMSNKKDPFSWRMVHPFFWKMCLGNLTAFWFSELDDVRDTWCLCR
jgi:hypothetical protein